MCVMKCQGVATVSVLALQGTYCIWGGGDDTGQFLGVDGSHLNMWYRVCKTFLLLEPQGTTGLG